MAQPSLNRTSAIIMNANAFCLHILAFAPLLHPGELLKKFAAAYRQFQDLDENEATEVWLYESSLKGS